MFLRDYKIYGDCQGVIFGVNNCHEISLIKKANFMDQSYFGTTDIVFSLKLESDSRFSYYYPTINKVSPIIESFNIERPSFIRISFLSFFSKKNLLVNKIIFVDEKYKFYCNEIKLVSNFAITCNIDFRLYPEIPFDYTLSGNVIMEIFSESNNYRLRSPQYTCKMFEYKKRGIEDRKIQVNPDKNIFKNEIIRGTCCKKNLPCCPLVKPITIPFEAMARLISDSVIPPTPLLMMLTLTSSLLNLNTALASASAEP